MGQKSRIALAAASFALALAMAAGAEKAELSYYTWYQSSDGNYPANMIAAFEKKYPDVKINLQVGSQNVDEYLEMQQVKLLSGKDIDVTSIRSESYASYVKAGYLLDLTGAGFLKNYNKSYVAMVTKDGKVYGVPYAMDVYGCIYNKTMFKEHGWKVPGNYQEFLGLCDAIKKAGITPTVQGYKDTWPIAQDLQLFMNRAVVKDPEIYGKIDAGKAKYTDKVFVDAMTAMNAFFKSSAVSATNMALTYDQAAAYFASGKAAMLMHGEWVLDSIRNAKPDFEIGVCPAPLNNTGEKPSGVVAITSVQAVAKLTKHPKEAKLFLDFISSAEGAALMDKALGNFSAVSGVPSEKLGLWKDVLSLPSVDFAYDYMYTGASSEMFKSAQVMFLGKMTPQEVCQAMQDAQDKKGK
jgi:raffinose/stachyose/melibiose transport system substrate-binding protein